jgi:hypothetical protein
MNSQRPALVKQLEELTIAHSSSILFYTRNKFSLKLAKSVRPEVAKVYITSEAKDCIEIIRKQNRHIDDDGIELVRIPILITSGIDVNSSSIFHSLR